MSVRASISKGYIWRPGLIGLAALGACGWFAYDGFVKYPHQQQMWQAHNQIFEEHKKRQELYDPNEAAAEWQEMAAAKGWPTKNPEGKSGTDILTQKAIAGITGPIGLFFCVVFVTSRGRWVQADDQGLTTSAGKRSSYESITSLDKSRWQSKGIAVVHYSSDGQTGRIVLDDWKFEREPTKQILQIVEDRTAFGDDADSGSEGDGASSDTLAKA